MKWVIAVMIAFAGMSCNKEKRLPADILPPEQMQAVFWDFLRADIYADDFLRADSLLDPEMGSAALQKTVFQKHKLSRDRFLKSYRYYSDHPELMKDMLDSMLVRQQRMPATIRKKFKVFDLNYEKSI